MKFWQFVKKVIDYSPNQEQPENETQEDGEGQNTGEKQTPDQEQGTREGQSEEQNQGSKEDQSSNGSQSGEENHSSNGGQSGEEEQSTNGSQSGEENHSSNGGQSGEEDQTSNGSQSGEEDQTSNSGQSGEEDQTSNSSQSGEEDQSSNGIQSGEEEQSTNGSQSGEEDQSSNGGQLGEEEQSSNSGQLGEEDQSSNVSQSGEEDQSSNSGQSGKEEQSSNVSQSGEEDQSSNGGQSGKEEQSSNVSQSGEEDQSSNGGQSGIEDQTSNGGQSGEEDQTSNSGQSGEEDQSSNDEQLDEEERLEQDQPKEEQKKELSEEANKFLDRLNDLPSFENRQRNDGYAIDTKSNSEIPDSVIRTLITKFLNQRFCKNNNDLNTRSSSLEKTEGFYKWEVKDVIVHHKTHQAKKVLKDKYSYDHADGKSENVPLSFYFDLSGSMSNYTNMLATIAIELLKKNVKVLIGFNEKVNVQIDSISKNITVEELEKVISSAGYYNWYYSTAESDLIKDSRVKFKFINRNIDSYLTEKKAQKCVIFSDFDPISEVINLSQSVQTYWFCFEKNFGRSWLKYYKGFIYPVQNANDILNGLVKVNENRFETLVYVDNPKTLQKRR